MAVYVAVPALISIAFLGWCAGMLTFKRSQRWCPRCGTSLKCPDCARAGLHMMGPTAVNPAQQMAQRLGGRRRA